jgi:hypothetical protein
MKKPKRSAKATKSPKLTRVTVKPREKTKAATKSPRAATTATRSKAARANISEGTRLYALAGRPTKAQFIKVYGTKGPAMTWEQRAAAGVDAKHFQAALKAKLGKVDTAVANS